MDVVVCDCAEMGESAFSQQVDDENLGHKKSHGQTEDGKQAAPLLKGQPVGPNVKQQVDLYTRKYKLTKTMHIN